MDARGARPAARPGRDDRAWPRRRTRGRLTATAGLRPSGRSGRCSSPAPIHEQRRRSPSSAAPKTSQPPAHGSSIARPLTEMSPPIGSSPAATRTVPTNVSPTIARACAAASDGSVEPARRAVASKRHDPRGEPDHDDRAGHPSGPDAAVTRSKGDTPAPRRRGTATASVDRGDDLQEVARPVGRGRLEQDSGRDHGPETAPDERRDGGRPRRDRWVEPGVERAAHQVHPVAPADRSGLEQGRHLVAVARAPAAGVEAQQPVTMQPFSTRGGMIPGWPSATGSGPSVILRVSTVRTPSTSTSIAKRSMPAGPARTVRLPP